MQLSHEHQELRDRLNGLSGAAFDKEYISAMIAEHQKAIGEFEMQAGVTPYSADTTNPSTGRGSGTSGGSTSSGGGSTTRGAGSSPAGTSGSGGTSGNSGTTSTDGARSLARELLPALRTHLTQAQAIQRELR
jgi:hypothetical protein